MWYAIAIAFLVIIALFLLGIYLIFRAASNKIGESVGKVPEQIVKETFSIIKDKLSKSNETRVSNIGKGDSKS